MSRREEVIGQSYPRNCFVFSVVLVLGSTPTDDSTLDSYKRLAAGLARRLRLAEVEGSFVSSAAKDPSALTELLCRVFAQLSACGSCRVPIGKCRG